MMNVSLRLPVLMVVLLLGMMKVPDLSSQPPALWKIAPNLRIGSIDDPHTSLSHVSGVLVARDGSIFIGLQTERTVRVFDRNGHFLRNIGRAGSGPGEFQEVSSIGFIADTLVVLDEVRGSVSRFTVEGRHLSTAGVTGPMFEYSSRPAVPQAAVRGAYLAVPRTNRDDRDSIPLIRMDGKGKLLGTITQLSSPGEVRSFRAMNISFNAPYPLRSSSLWKVDTEGRSIVVVHRPIADSQESAHFLLERYTVTGNKLFTRRFRYTPLRVSSVEADTLLAGYIRFWSNQVPRPVAQRLARDSLGVPEFHPPIAQIAIGTDGSIWLRRSGLVRRDVEWLVHAPDGRLIATVRTPPNLSIMHVQPTKSGR